MTFTLPSLPYSVDALAPTMSAETLEFHYNKHHKGYLDKLNELIDGTPYADLSLEDVIVQSDQMRDAAIFNNAAQHWNHSHFWEGMTAKGGGKVPGRLEKALVSEFGSLVAFTEKFKAACIAQFGSGWAWLVLNTGRPEIIKTGNAGTPATLGQTALLTCDVWEHAYYIDHRNLRARYVDAFLSNLVNWERIAERYDLAAIGA
jgi:superoxide dismutase, Fe-Mn family